MTLVQGTINRKNVEKICRLCLKENTTNQDFSEYLEFCDKFDIKATIKDAFSKLTLEVVKTDDGLPHLLCLECVELLKQSYIFRLTYEESLSIFGNYLSSLKEEEESKISVFEDDDDDAEPLITDDDDDDEDFTVKSKADKNTSNQRKTRAASKKRSGAKDTTVKQGKKRGRPKKGLKKELKVEDHQSDADVKSDEDEDSELLLSKTILYPCPVCPLEFTPQELRRHVHSHKSLKKYLSISKQHKLKPSSKFVARKRKLSTLVSMFDVKGNKHKCPYCDKEFNTPSFRIHIDTHRRQDEYKCDQCDRIFGQMNHLNTHRLKHLKEYPYKCEQCGKGFVIETNYTCHLLTHTSAELPHECSYCLKRFSNPTNLYRHMTIHTENVTYADKYKAYRCRRCLRTFKDKDKLQEHVCDQAIVQLKQNSTKALRYPCKKCNKVYKCPSGLYNHNKNIHELKRVKTLCPVCGIYLTNIYTHMKRHSGDRPHKCNQCEKSFSTKPKLRQHLLVHSGLKPFVCSICAKSFNNICNLQVHEKIHKGDRQHTCDICNKSFLQKSYLKKHMHVHTKLQ